MIVRRWFHSCSVRWSRLPRRAAIPAVLGAFLVFGVLVFLPLRARIIVKPIEDLAQIPEVELPLNFFAGPTLPSIDDLAQATAADPGAPLAEALSHVREARKAAGAVAQINRLNKKTPDGAVELVQRERRDLAGLPFAMGEACRMKAERKQPFAFQVQEIRHALAQAQFNCNGPRDFWEVYQAPGQEKADQADMTLARIAALMQILAAEPVVTRQGLVKYLSTVAHAETTRALARLAIYSVEEEVRQQALAALTDRQAKDYCDVLLQGMHYPWPAVAERAANAMVKLECSELLPQLVDLLDEPDPRAPVLTEVNQKKVPVVRELVRVNHHKNCLLCHAPADAGSASQENRTGRSESEGLTAPIPLPSDPLPSPFDGYGRPPPKDILVRIDVTYLRQDFTVIQPVKHASPWPELQRFDFLVRTRQLTGNEAAAYQEAYGARSDGQLSPYQQAALTALRSLTGKDTAPRAEAWRRLLDPSAS